MSETASSVFGFITILLLAAIFALLWKRTQRPLPPVSPAPVEPAQQTPVAPDYVPWFSEVVAAIHSTDAEIIAELGKVQAAVEKVVAEISTLNEAPDVVAEPSRDAEIIAALEKIQAGVEKIPDNSAVVAGLDKVQAAVREAKPAAPIIVPAPAPAKPAYDPNAKPLNVPEVIAVLEQILAVLERISRPR